MPMNQVPATLPHAREHLDAWRAAWRRSGVLVLLLDFDGTLAPIVERPEAAAPLPAALAATRRLAARADVRMAVISGRGLADVRSRLPLEGVDYAGNHGMEIEGPGLDEIHPEARAARPRLEEAAESVRALVARTPGALLEDKGLTLSVHYRMSPEGPAAEMRAGVRAAVAPLPGVRLTEGKMVLEIRPEVDWDKGKAVRFLLDRMRPPAGAPILYLGDDTTDEDAFRELAGRGEGVLVTEQPAMATAAGSWVRDPVEVAALLTALADGAEQG
jgi:trehalose 6-phosphate phosphatase